MNEEILNSEEEIDLRELFKVLFDGKILIALVASIITFSSVIYALMMTDYYKSEAVMSVRDNSENKNLLSQFGGAASLMGLNVSSTDDKASQTIQLIQSRKFIKHLLTFENILPSIMAAKSYDISSKKLLFDGDLYDSKSKNWIGEPDENGSAKPSYLDAHGVYLNDLLSISQDKNTGFILIDIKHLSPVFAKEFLELIIRETNTILRKKDLEESNEALMYLTNELRKTSLVELKESIKNLIEAQLEVQMMSKINEDYVLVEIDPPFIPERGLSNSKLLIVIFSAIFGSLLGGVIVLIRHYFLKEKLIEA
tara:strand:- start:8319 stop:9248 length:930 start_codon:yes stop_codon:yes gene_type:complete